MKTAHIFSAQHRRAKSGYSARSQRGIVLVLVLMMLGIMSIIGALTMRNSAVTEQITNNLRTSNVAHQAAELALKFCEQVAVDSNNTSSMYATARNQIVSSTITGTITSGAWNQTTTWKGSSIPNVIKVTNTFSMSGYSSSGDATGITFRNPPQCVIENLANNTGVGFVITARGFGNDAQIDANNVVTAGSESWVQSVLIR